MIETIIFAILFLCIGGLIYCVRNLTETCLNNIKAIDAILDVQKTTMEYTQLVAQFVGLRPKQNKSEDAKPS